MYSFLVWFRNSLIVNSSFASIAGSLLVQRLEFMSPALVAWVQIRWFGASTSCVCQHLKYSELVNSSSGHERGWFASNAQVPWAQFLAWAMAHFDLTVLCLRGNHGWFELIPPSLLPVHRWGRKEWSFIIFTLKSVRGIGTHCVPSGTQKGHAFSDTTRVPHIESGICYFWEFYSHKCL